MPDDTTNPATVQVGHPFPDVTLTRLGPDGPEPIGSGEVLGRGTTVLFAVPGAFTPTCSDHHLPGFLLRHDDLRAAGADVIACVSVNDAWVMAAWGEAQGVGDRLLMLADGNGDLAHELGLVLDGRARGMGLRSRRYAAILDDGIVTTLLVEDVPGLDRSSAESVLAALRERAAGTPSATLS